MMQKNIIGLTGSAGAGKDTFASYYKELNDDTDVFAYAEPLKAATKILFNLTDSQLYSPIEKEVIDERYNKTPRQILQYLGTDIIRKIKDDIFITGMKERIEKSNKKNIIVTDCRFDNECKLILELGGKVIKISRPITITSESNHSSEAGVSPDLVNITLNNDGTVEEFKELIKSNGF